MERTYGFEKRLLAVHIAAGFLADKDHLLSHTSRDHRGEALEAAYDLIDQADDMASKREDLSKEFPKVLKDHEDDLPF